MKWFFTVASVVSDDEHLAWQNYTLSDVYARPVFVYEVPGAGDENSMIPENLPKTIVPDLFYAYCEDYIRGIVMRILNNKSRKNPIDAVWNFLGNLQYEVLLHDFESLNIEIQTDIQQTANCENTIMKYFPYMYVAEIKHDVSYHFVNLRILREYHEIKTAVLVRVFNSIREKILREITLTYGTIRLK